MWYSIAHDDVDLKSSARYCLLNAAVIAFNNENYFFLQEGTNIGAVLGPLSIDTSRRAGLVNYGAGCI